MMFGVRTFSRSTQSSARRSLLARVDQARTRQAGEIGQGDVGRNRQKQHETFDAPFARDVADAEIDRLGGRRQPRLAAGDLETAGRMRSEAGERARQLLAARADDAGDPQNLPGAELEADVSVGLAERKLFDFQQRPASWNGFCKGSR